MKKIESTWETKADVMGDTRADVRAEVSFWKVEKYLVLSDILFGFIFECSKDGCSSAGCQRYAKLASSHLERA